MRPLAALMALALVTACSGGQDTDPSPGEARVGERPDDPDVLVVGALEPPRTLDPAKARARLASDVLLNTTERLVDFPPGRTRVGPGLATEWDVSADGRTYTFTLREDVTFHDGSAFDGEDVVFSLRRVMDIDHPDGAAFLLDPIASVDAPEPHEVVVRLHEPDVTLLPRLASAVASIVPSDSDAYPAPEGPREEGDGDGGRDDAGEDGRAEAERFVNDSGVIGTGPYRLVGDPSAGRLTLEAFEGYRGQAPRTPTVRFRFFDDAAAMRDALAAGRIDLNVGGFGPADRELLERTDGLNVAESAGAYIRYLVLDVTQEPFDDRAVRRAISASLDRERIVADVLDGAGLPLHSMIPRGFAAAHADHLSDLEAAELADAPIPFDLWHSRGMYGDTEPALAEAIARSLDSSGLFDVTVRSADWDAEYAANLDTGAYGAFLLAWYPDYFDPDDYVAPFYSSRGFTGYYRSGAMDRLITAERRETDPEERMELFDEIQRLAARDMPFVPLYEDTPFAYYREGLIGVEDTMDTVQRVRYWLIGKG